MGSSRLICASWEVSPMGHWFLIVIIVPNGLVKQLMHCVKVAIKKALKRLIKELLG